MTKPLRITEVRIKVIENSQQRYTTSGDWRYEPDREIEGGTVLLICVSKMPDQRHEQLVMIHELVEVLLCNQRGITQELVDGFDFQYEKEHPGTEGEPGDCSDAPYRDEHCAATAVERMMCVLFGIGWSEYEQQINELFDLK